MSQKQRIVLRFTALSLVLAIWPVSLAQDAPVLNTRKDRLSYAFGVSSVSAARRQLPDVDLNQVLRGFKDTISGNALLTEADVDAAMADLQDQMNARQAEMNKVYTAMQGVIEAHSKAAMTETEAFTAIADLQKQLAELQGQRKGKVALPSETNTTNTAAPQNPKAKLSYAFGMTYANALQNAVQKESLDIDPNLVLRGLKEAVSGKPSSLTPREVHVAMSALRKQVTLTTGERNKRQGEAFLAENKTKEGVVALESGLQYKILKAGDGNKPTIDDMVVCHYRGTLLDGTQFDSSYERNQPGTFALQQTMMGWREALQLMPAGSKWRLFVPGPLARWPGAARSGIGPNATLIFEIELISIQGKS
jgi:FKBP-type peptidyl-prolyl cis-trans isomerase